VISFLIESKSVLSQPIERMPKEAIDRHDENRHDRDAEHDAGVIGRFRRVCDERAKASGPEPSVAPIGDFRDNAGVP
jgi:hypothetical protein